MIGWQTKHNLKCHFKKCTSLSSQCTLNWFWNATDSFHSERIVNTQSIKVLIQANIFSSNHFISLHINVQSLMRSSHRFRWSSGGSTLQKSKEKRKISAVKLGRTSKIQREIVYTLGFSWLILITPSYKLTLPFYTFKLCAHRFRFKLYRCLTLGLKRGGGVRSLRASRERFLTTLLWMAQLTQ